MKKKHPTGADSGSESMLITAHYSSKAGYAEALPASGSKPHVRRSGRQPGDGEGRGPPKTPPETSGSSSHGNKGGSTTGGPRSRSLVTWARQESYCKISLFFLI